LSIYISSNPRSYSYDLLRVLQTLKTAFVNLQRWVLRYTKTSIKPYFGQISGLL